MCRNKKARCGIADAWSLDQEPHQCHQKLGRDQGAADGHLGSGADETRPLGAIPCPTEYPRDPIGLGEEGGITDSERGTQAETPKGADDCRRFGDVDEGHGVAQEDSQQEDVGQPTSTCLHHWGVIVAQEHPSNRHGA